MRATCHLADYNQKSCIDRLKNENGFGKDRDKNPRLLLEDKDKDKDKKSRLLLNAGDAGQGNRRLAAS